MNMDHDWRIDSGDERVGTALTLQCIRGILVIESLLKEGGSNWQLCIEFLL